MPVSSFARYNIPKLKIGAIGEKTACQPKRWLVFTVEWILGEKNQEVSCCQGDSLPYAASI